MWWGSVGVFEERTSTLKEQVPYYFSSGIPSTCILAVKLTKMKPFELKAAHALLIGMIGFFVPAHAQTTLILAPSQDAELGYHDNFGSANTNYNSSTHCSAFAQPGASGGVNKGRGLMKFDLSSIPPDATVFGAFLTLFPSGPLAPGTVTSVGSTGQNASKVYRITAPWADNTVTWNNQPATTNLNAAALPQSTYSMQTYLNIDVSALVQDMVADPSNSFGFMLKLDNETPSRGLLFYGGLAPNSDMRPQLVVAYGDCDKVNIDENDQGAGRLTISPSILSPGASVQLDMGRNVSGSSNLVLLNNLGQPVYTRAATNWPMTVTIPALAQGAYTWKVQDSSGTILGVARMVVR